MRGSRQRSLTFVFALASCGLLASLKGAPAQQKEDAEERLRSALRQTTMQLRDREDQNATLLAKQAEAERDRLALTEKLAADEKELVGLRQQAKSGQAALQQTADAQKETLTKWESAYKDAADVARTRDADAKRMDAALVRLREQINICQTKNAELYRLGQDLLALYDDKGFLSVVGASEPVTKLKRVEYENIMQDYEDRLRANQLTQPSP